MSQSKRPGGLTTLAVLNFVWSGFLIIAVLGIMAAIAIIPAATDGLNEVSDSDPSVSVEMAELPMSSLYTSLLSSAVTAALLIISGIGYLGLKKTMGFKMGNLYAILSIIFGIISIVMLSDGFEITNIIGFIYPIVTLFLLNTTFKEDFIN